MKDHDITNVHGTRYLRGATYLAVQTKRDSRILITSAGKFWGVVFRIGGTDHTFALVSEDGGYLTAVRAFKAAMGALASEVLPKHANASIH